MKLVTRTSLFYLLSGIPILIFSGVICFEIALEELQENSDTLLYNFERQIERYIKKKDTVSLKTIGASGEAEITEVDHPVGHKLVFSDTVVLDRRENEYNENRMLTSYLHAHGKNFRIRISRATMESEQLVYGISTALLTILVLLFVIYLVLNLYTTKILWKPFYKALDNLRDFHASNGKAPVFIASKIDEFRELNASLDTMMRAMIADYDRQKKFTEAVSHEIQTPLAVIKSKIDLMIQSPEINNGMAPLITAVDDACSKLIRINRSLILLTRIENRQFKADDEISFIKKIQGALQLFEDHILIADITVTTDFQADFVVMANSDLCLVLVNNLIQNAIRHNKKGGTIVIVVQKDGFSVSNSGQEMPLNQDLLFKRFNKDNQIGDSIGLGLSIAKEIADTNNLTLRYDYTNSRHTFTVERIGREAGAM